MVPLLRIRSSRRPGRTPTEQGRGVRGPGVPAAHGGAGPCAGLLRRVHGLRQPRPPLRHRRHLRGGPIRRRRHLAPRVEGAAVPVQPGLQLLPLPARPKSAGPDSDRVWPGLRGADDQTGELALVAIRGVTWILERFPSLACASLRQGLSEPRSGRWRTSSKSGPALTTTCCCGRRRLRPAAAREGPTLVVACGWDTISYSSSIRHLASDNVFVIQRVTRPSGGINEWLHFLPISMHKLIDQVLRQLFRNTRFAIVATRVERWRKRNGGGTEGRSGGTSS